MPDEERKAVELVQEAFGMSQGQACRRMGADRSTVRYEKKPTEDHQIVDRMKNLLEKRPRFGCPRVHPVLRSERLVKNHKRTERIYYGNGLQLKKRKPKRRVYKPENPRSLVQDSHNHRRMLTRVSCDENRDTSLSGHRVVRVLKKLKAERGLPEEIGVDQGPEFISNALTKWAWETELDSTTQAQAIRMRMPLSRASMDVFGMSA